MIRYTPRALCLTRCLFEHTVLEGSWPVSVKGNINSPQNGAGRNDARVPVDYGDAELHLHRLTGFSPQGASFNCLTWFRLGRSLVAVYTRPDVTCLTA